MCTLYSLNKKNIDLLQDRHIFCDANVLIELFSKVSPEPSSLQRDTSKIYDVIFKQRRKNLFVDFNVISEFINRTHRMQFQDWKRFEECKQGKANPELDYKKDFRNSRHGKNTLNDIYMKVKNLLNHFQVAGKAFQGDDVEHFLQLDELDFVDKAIKSICQEKNMILFTNDIDFKNSGVDVLTANLKFLD
jgi:predicted nucleic acid-binding protein